MIKGHMPKLSFTAEHYDSKGNLKAIVPNKPMPKCNATIDFIVRHGDGSIDKKVKIPARSFVQNFLEVFKDWASNDGAPWQWVQTSGAAGDQRMSGLNINRPYNSVYGIVIGTSDTAVAFSDYALGAQIMNGTGAGQMQHYAVYRDALLDDGTNYGTVVRRIFCNDSGASITVKEVGIYAYVSSRAMMICRDIVDSLGASIDITIGPTQVLEVVYTIYAAKSSGWTKTHAEALRETLWGTTTDTTDIDGNPASPTLASNTWTWWFSEGGVGETIGPMVGTSSAAIDADHFALQTPIVHGSGAGQLNHDVVTISDTSGDANTQSFFIRRLFSNYSAGSITINEAGWYTYVTSDTAYFMMARGLFSNPVAIAPNESIRVTIEMGIIL